MTHCNYDTQIIEQPTSEVNTFVQNLNNCYQLIKDKVSYNKNYFKVLHCIIDTATKYHGTDMCFKTQQNIANYVGCTVRTVRNITKELARLGLIKYLGRVRRRCNYTPLEAGMKLYNELTGKISTESDDNPVHNLNSEEDVSGFVSGFPRNNYIRYKREKLNTIVADAQEFDCSKNEQSEQGEQQSTESGGLSSCYSVFNKLCKRLDLGEVETKIATSLVKRFKLSLSDFKHSVDLTLHGKEKGSVQSVLGALIGRMKTMVKKDVEQTKSAHQLVQDFDHEQKLRKHYEDAAYEYCASYLGYDILTTSDYDERRKFNALYDHCLTEFVERHKKGTLKFPSHLTEKGYSLYKPRL